VPGRLSGPSRRKVRRLLAERPELPWDVAVAVVLDVSD
jgi:hypothetical protein